MKYVFCLTIWHWLEQVAFMYLRVFLNIQFRKRGHEFGREQTGVYEGYWWEDWEEENDVL